MRSPGVRTGALELEGTIDPTAIVQQMSALFATAATPAETVRGWRYHLDAERVSDQRVTVGVRFTDTGEELTAHLRNCVLVGDDGIADDCDAVVELTAADLAAGAVPTTTVSGDSSAWSALTDLLDLEVSGFHMHMR